MTADEVSHMSSEKELVFVAGHKPIFGDKLRYYLQPFFLKRLNMYQGIYVKKHGCEAACKKYTSGGKLSATLLHLPVSTTHVVSGSIMGVGTAKRLNAVRWGVAQQMVMAWVLTIPCTAVMGALAYQLVLLIFG